MKKLLICLLTISMFLPVTGKVLKTQKNINADSLYPVACEIFEVSEAQDDGSFKKVSCHSDFSSAKKAMKANEDYVVRMASGYSPMKIVAMNSGYAYSYPARSGSTTMDIYYTPSFSGSNDYTYISTKGIETTYVDTYSLNDSLNGMGKAQVIINGWKGYCDLEYIDLVPRKFVEKSIPVYLGGNDATNKNEQAYRVIPEANYYILKQNNNYLDIEFHCHYNYPTSGEKAYAMTKKFGSGEQYTSFMKVGEKYYSNNGIDFFSDSRLTKYVGSAYSYYQFLPFRTLSNISADVFESYISDQTNSVLKGNCKVFTKNQEKYGINALMLFAMACQESAYGTSSIARSNYNLFGWNALDSNPGAASTYNSVEECIIQQMGYNLRKYLDRAQGVWYGSCVGTKGVGFNVSYASDPYWGYNIASIAYDIDKYSNNYNGKLTDYGKYMIGVVDEYECALYSDASTKSNVYYKMRYRENHFNDYTVVLLGEKNGMILTQSTNPIAKDGTVIQYGSISDSDYKNVIGYDFDTSVGYIKQDSLWVEGNYTQPITPSDNPDDGNEDPGTIETPYIENASGFASIRTVTMGDNVITITGIGAMSQMDFNNADANYHTLNIYDIETGKLYKSYKAKSVDSEGYSMNDNHNYKYAAYSADIPYQDLKQGSYSLKIEITNGKNDKEIELRSSIQDLSNRVKTNNGITYLLNNNDMYNYRIEIDVLSTILDYSKISKPSTRNSLVAYEDIYFDENNKLNIEGHAFIYYQDFSKTNNPVFELYLIDSANNYLKLDTITTKSTRDYKSMLNMSNNLDYINFTATGDISKLDGDYALVLVIKSGNSYDICNVNNRAQGNLPSLKTSGIDCKFYSTEFRQNIRAYFD